MTQLIETKGLDELIDRMKRYPAELHKALSLTMSSALIALWESVPPYPPPPEDSTYKRTGTLGKSLGADVGGGSLGEPDIFTVKPLGDGYVGTFGSNLDYAPQVIGDTTQSPRMSHWWTIKVISERAAEKIGRLFNALGEKLAQFLEGKG